MLTRASGRKRQAKQVEGDEQATTPTVAASNQARPAKKRKVQNSNPDITENKPVTRVRRKGVLKEMLEMPLDILFEIFGELRPQDLLALSRTTKDFRNLLISKSSIHFWKAAFENAPELPAAFPGMNELAFANLLFSNHCHNCFKANVRNVFWVFRARFCNGCKNKRLLKFDLSTKMKHLGLLKKGSQFVYEFLPVILLNPNTQRYYQQEHQYLVDKEWVEELKKSWKGLLTSSNGETDQHILDERRDFIQRNREAAYACSEWYSKKLDQHEAKLDQLRADRLSAILDRLRDLGYGVEIDNYSEETEKALREEKIVREPKLLTDRMWLNLQPTAVKIMDGVRNWRIDEEYKSTLRSRMSMVINSLTKFRGRVYGDINFPSPMDFLSIPCIRSIIEVPAEVTFTLEGFMDKINPMLPEILEEWRKSVDAHLVHLIKPKSDIPKEVDPLSIAIGQFFFCESCRQPLIYPNIRAHSCLLDDVDQEDTEDVYEAALWLAFDNPFSREYIEPNLFIKPRHLILENIISMANIVEKVLTVLGYDAGQITLKELEGVATLMVCTSCENYKPWFRQVMDWRTMILHAISQHQNLDSFSARLATDAEVKKISTLKERNYNGSRDNHVDYYMCAHCDDFDDFVAKYKITAHLSNNHNISRPSDEIEEHDVIESSDTFASFRTESAPFRPLISRKDFGYKFAWDIFEAEAAGYGTVCDFDDLDKKSSAGTETVGTDTHRLSENVEVEP
ncbi:hypothetical protein C8Q75DRAFT_892816 [Abortiporus biennis]|nr:hypothetical protein C8Q75DRAFT_892816 [Abortiporus biennis]